MSSGKSKTMATPLLPISHEKDTIGNFLVVECGSLKGRLYVAKMDSTKCGVGKCIFFDGKGSHLQNLSR